MFYIFGLVHTWEKNLIGFFLTRSHKHKICINKYSIGNDFEMLNYEEKKEPTDMNLIDEYFFLSNIWLIHFIFIFFSLI